MVMIHETLGAGFHLREQRKTLICRAASKEALAPAIGVYVNLVVFHRN